MTRRLSFAAALSLTALTLTSCAGSNPGDAARIGDQSIGLTRVDQLAKDVCEVFTPRLRAQHQLIPMSFVRSGVLQLLVVRAQAEQLAADYGVTPTADYHTEVATETQAAAAFPTSVQANYAEVLSSSAYANSLVIPVGVAALAREGVSNPTSSDAKAKGTAIFSAWAEHHTFQTDPRFGLVTKNGQLLAGDVGVSFPLSSVALQGLAEQPDQSYIDALPVAQRCGG